MYNIKCSACWQHSRPCNILRLVTQSPPRTPDRNASHTWLQCLEQTSSALPAPHACEEHKHITSLTCIAQLIITSWRSIACVAQTTCMPPHAHASTPIHPSADRAAPVSAETSVLLLHCTTPCGWHHRHTRRRGIGLGARHAQRWSARQTRTRPGAPGAPGGRHTRLIRRGRLNRREHAARRRLHRAPNGPVHQHERRRQEALQPDGVEARARGRQAAWRDFRLGMAPTSRRVTELLCKEADEGAVLRVLMTDQMVQVQVSMFDNCILGCHALLAA